MLVLGTVFILTGCGNNNETYSLTSSVEALSEKEGLTYIDEYLSLKKQMAEELVGKKSQSVSNEDVTALTSAFDIDEEEAKKILNDCGNDLRKAIKLLRVKTLKDDS